MDSQYQIIARTSDVYLFIHKAVQWQCPCINQTWLVEVKTCINSFQHLSTYGQRRHDHVVLQVWHPVSWSKLSVPIGVTKDILQALNCLALNKAPLRQTSRSWAVCFITKRSINGGHTSLFKFEKWRGISRDLL